MGKSGAEKDIEGKRGTFDKGTYGEDDTIHFRSEKRIITNEERQVNIMGGTIIETESERLIRLGMCQGMTKMIIEIGREHGLDDAAILKRIQEEVGWSLEDAKAYLKQYGNEDEKIRAFHRLDAARTEIRCYLSDDFVPDKELKEAQAERYDNIN